MDVRKVYERGLLLLDRSPLKEMPAFLDSLNAKSIAEPEAALVHDVLFARLLRIQGRTREAMLHLDSLDRSAYADHPLLDYYLQYTRAQTYLELEYYDDAKATAA